MNVKQVESLQCQYQFLHYSIWPILPPRVAISKQTPAPLSGRAQEAAAGAALPDPDEDEDEEARLLP